MALFHHLPRLAGALGLALGLGLAPLIAPQAALGQSGTGISFGGLVADTRLPVDIKAEELSINQKDGTARFSGAVKVVQGEMRLSADVIEVDYAQPGDSAAGGNVKRLRAKGNVLIVNASDAAEGDEAIYTIATGEVIVTGNVLLTQGPATMAAQRLVINLQTGLGRLEGGVTTTFQPQGGN